MCSYFETGPKATFLVVAWYVAVLGGLGHLCILTVMELQNSREHKRVQYLTFLEKLNVVLFNHLLKMVIAT